jgi:hypothetical protein
LILNIPPPDPNFGLRDFKPGRQALHLCHGTFKLLALALQAFNLLRQLLPIPIYHIIPL